MAALPDIALAMTDELGRRADEIEQARRLPADIVEKFAGNGFYAMCAPRAYGGLECEPEVMMRVVETLATADGSAAWCAFIGASSAAVLAYLPPEQARTLFDRPTRVFGGTFAPRGTAVREDGAYRVDGRWQWGSGTQGADWVMGGCVVLRDGEPERLPSGAPRSRMFLVHKSDVVFHDTWYVSGLSGTGSTDFSFVDLVIPEGRSVDLVAGPVLDTPLYKFPVFGLLAIGISCVALGLGRAAIDALCEIAGTKIPGMSARPLAARARAQTDVARAEALVASARSFLYDSVGRAWDSACSRGAIALEQRRDVRLAASHAVESARVAVDLMYGLGGGTSVYKTSPLQRIFRDIHVATQHMMVGDASWELVGRLYLGVDTDTSMI
jgi:alkylation response protein AidB-like acyl-CoA dehydrogenase